MAPKIDPPATDSQKRYMDKLGLSYAATITKAQATALIGTRLEPESETIEILKYFRVSTKGMHQTAARHRLAEIMADPNNVARWEQRPATAEQIAQLTFYGVQPIPGLSHSAASARLDAICEADPTRADAWDAELARLEAAESEIDDLIELAPDYSSDYGCRRLPKKLARQVVLALIAEGITAEDIDKQFYAPLFKRAADIDPSIVKDHDQLARHLARMSLTRR